MARWTCHRQISRAMPRRCLVSSMITLSPVTITIFVPKSLRPFTSAAESARGESSRAITPAKPIYATVTMRDRQDPRSGIRKPGEHIRRAGRRAGQPRDGLRSAFDNPELAVRDRRARRLPGPADPSVNRVMPPAGWQGRSNPGLPDRWRQPQPQHVVVRRGIEALHSCDCLAILRQRVGFIRTQNIHSSRLFDRG
jgi:hypothetical protein